MTTPSELQSAFDDQALLLRKFMDLVLVQSYKFACNELNEKWDSVCVRAVFVANSYQLQFTYLQATSMMEKPLFVYSHILRIARQGLRRIKVEKLNGLALRAQIGKDGAGQLFIEQAEEINE